MKKDLTKILIDEIYSTQRRKSFPTNKIFCNNIDEIWSIDVADKVDYKISKTEKFRYIFITTDNFSKNIWPYLLKTKKSKKITNEFSNILTSSEQKPDKIESDTGAASFTKLFKTS